MSTLVPTQPPLRATILATCVWLLLLGYILTQTADGKIIANQDLRVRGTIHLSLAFYALAATLMLRLVDWSTETARGRLARTCWSLACLAYLIHVACAFHYAHHWSHAEAFEHVRQAGGVGEGIFVSYLFTLLWSADVIWWWTAPTGYARRSSWIDRSLHGFMLFVIFNATIVFESGLVRWAGVALFVWLAAVWLASRGSSTSSSSES